MIINRGICLKLRSASLMGAFGSQLPFIYYSRCHSLFLHKFTLKANVPVIRIVLTLFAILFVFHSFSQDTTDKTRKELRKERRKDKVNTMVRQDEEGVLVYSKQSIFGLQLRTLGYGAFYEHGRMKSNRITNIYRLDFTETKHPKEDKLPNGGISVVNPYIYGKINNFYQFHLGFGQQRILGQKGNKNGVAVTAVYTGGLLAGLLRPYYLQIEDNGEIRTIKYSKEDSALFVGGLIQGGGGLGKGWGEMKFKPGAFAKASLRFDFGRFNEVVSGLEVGLSAEFYSSKIPIMLFQKEKQLFLQGHIAVMFGHRK